MWDTNGAAFDLGCFGLTNAIPTGVSDSGYIVGYCGTDTNSSRFLFCIPPTMSMIPVSASGRSGLISGYDYNRIPFTNSASVAFSGYVSVSNLTYSSPRWMDALYSGMGFGQGGTVPVRTEVEAGTSIYGRGWDQNDDGDFSIQFPHTLSATNVNLPQFYYEPHLHISCPSGAYSAGQSNVAFTITYTIAAPLVTYSNTTVTITATQTCLLPHKHYLLEFGHKTNNALAGTVSAVVQGNLKRIACGDGDIAGRIIVDSLDFHVPVDRLGSRSDASEP
jgi:hypothetical protein